MKIDKQHAVKSEPLRMNQEQAYNKGYSEATQSERNRILKLIEEVFQIETMKEDLQHRGFNGLSLTIADEFVKSIETLKELLKSQINKEDKQK